MSESPIRLELQSHVQFEISRLSQHSDLGGGVGGGTASLHFQTFPCLPNLPVSGAGQRGGLAEERGLAEEAWLRTWLELLLIFSQPAWLFYHVACCHLPNAGSFVGLLGGGLSFSQPVVDRCPCQLSSCKHPCVPSCWATFTPLVTASLCLGVLLSRQQPSWQGEGEGILCKCFKPAYLPQPPWPQETGKLPLYQRAVPSCPLSVGGHLRLLQRSPPPPEFSRGMQPPILRSYTPPRPQGLRKLSQGLCRQASGLRLH